MFERMRWHMSHRADLRALPLANRHYNRQAPESPQFVPPGRCLVLLAECERALWVTSWQYAAYVRHAWAGAWVNSLFRNEGAGLSSDLIREAVAATCWHWPAPPTGIVTFVDPAQVRSTNPGYCYIQAGWTRVGHTRGGLRVLQQLPGQMPPATPPIGAQGRLWPENGSDGRE